MTPTHPAPAKTRAFPDYTARPEAAISPSRPKPAKAGFSSRGTASFPDCIRNQNAARPDLTATEAAGATAGTGACPDWLLCHVHVATLSDDGDLDLPRIGQLLLDLAGEVTR